MLVKQRIQLNNKLFVGIAAAVTVALALPIFSAYAQEATSTANTLKVSPVRTDVEVKPGESKIVKTTVTNLTANEISVHPAMNDFGAGDENGTPALILDEEKYAESHSLKRFMTPIADFKIPAKESKTLEVLIKVPATAKPGGYFGAVRFSPSKADTGGQVNLSASVASIILLTVPGEATESLELTNFDFVQDGKTYGTFFNTSNNIELSPRFKNNGSIQVAPFGKVSVKSGDKVVYEADFNTNNPREMVLPSSARRWNVPLNELGTFGKYTVTATFTYGKSNKTLQTERTLWIVPKSVIIGGIIGLIVVLAAAGWGIYAYTKKRSRTGGRTSSGRGSNSSN